MIDNHTKYNDFTKLQRFDICVISSCLILEQIMTFSNQNKCNKNRQLFTYHIVKTQLTMKTYIYLYLSLNMSR